MERRRSGIFVFARGGDRSGVVVVGWGENCMAGVTLLWTVRKIVVCIHSTPARGHWHQRQFVFLCSVV